MNVLDHFSVPYLGLKDGKHQYTFQVDDAFFKCFENSIIHSGSFEVDLYLDKRPDMGVAEFEFFGDATLECDRCLSPFTLPLEGESRLLIKYGDEYIEDDELMIIPHETSHINFAQYIYETLGLSLPFARTHEFEEDCDPVIINKMRQQRLEDDEDNVWNSLKNLDLN